MLFSSVSVIGVALVTKYGASLSQRRLRQGCINLLYGNKRPFTRPSLLAGWNASILKVGVVYWWKMTNASPVIIIQGSNDNSSDLYSQ